MKSVKISLQMAQNVKDFVSIVQEYPYEIDLKSEKYVVDAKSILGIFQTCDRRDPFGQLRRPDRRAQKVRLKFAGELIPPDRGSAFEKKRIFVGGVTRVVPRRKSACRYRAKRSSTN